MALTTKFRLNLTARDDTSIDAGSKTQNHALNVDNDYANGTGAGQANLVFSDTRTLAASGTEDLDLAGTLADAYGATITNVRVKSVAIKADAGNTNNVVVGAAASNAWATLLNSTGTITLRPGAALGVAAGEADATGWAVTAGTGDLLKVANSGGTTGVTYTIVIVGASA